MYYEYVPDARPYAEPHDYKGAINLICPTVATSTPDK